VPELPEVEIVRAGITRHISGNTIVQVLAHSVNLRWPISLELATILPGQIVLSVERRGKYLLLHCQTGVVLVHLGMTGYLRIVSAATVPDKHDHFDIVFHDGIVLRLNDVRRFGSVLWAGADPQKHELLAGMGPEPLTEVFDGTYLYLKSRGRKISIKQFIMDHKVVAGVGNIYANESLFHAGIRPSTPAGRLSKVRSQELVSSIKAVLNASIKVGGTMIDFRDGTEKLGYFHQELMVYKRGGQPCKVCATPIQLKRVGLRSNYYCKTCQR
jgi:formamidopyrimidine-DNA glycosylase